MDELQFQLLFDDEVDSDMDGGAAIHMVLVLGVQAARDLHNERRRAHRYYLTRPDLLPNPRFGTPWQRLYEGQNPRAFVTTMGFDVKTFNRILHSGFAEAWNTRPIPRDDVERTGDPRLGRRSLDAAGALGLALHYVSSAMTEITLQEVFALIPSTTARYLDFSLDLLLETTRIMPEGDIGWYKTEKEFEEDAALVTDRHPLLEGAFGTGDGLSVHTGSSSDPEIENATFNGWKSDHRINNIFVFSPRGERFSSRTA